MTLQEMFSALLTGHTLEVYSRLPASVANDYDHSKQSLLEWYQWLRETSERSFIHVRQVLRRLFLSFMFEWVIT